MYLEVEGSVPATMAKSIGLGISEFASEFQRLRPHVVLLIGDRYEALAAAIAAAYMNIPLAHIQGGEVSGSITSAPATQSRSLRSCTSRPRNVLPIPDPDGRAGRTVFNFGCPAGDYILESGSLA